MSTMIRVSDAAATTYGLWCERLDCSMPQLHDRMIEYGVRQKQQRTYESLPTPSRWDKRPDRRKRNKIKR